MNITRGELIAVEGIDGSGTTTQARMLADSIAQHLLELNTARREPPVWETFEPTDGPVGRIVRQALRGELTFSDEALLALFAADRDWHVYNLEGIAARAVRGVVTVTARYYLSTIAYNARTPSLLSLASALNRQYPWPDLTVVLDVPPETALERIRKRGKPAELFERGDRLTTVRECYLSLAASINENASEREAKGEPFGYVEVVDGTGTAEEVHARVLGAVRTRLLRLRDI